MHSPYDFPEVAGRGFTLEQGNEAFVGIWASYTESTSKVEAMDISRRKCIKANEPWSELPEEFHLLAFKHYRRASCLLECRANQLQKECGCLPYFFPHFEGVWKVDTSCNLTGLACLANKLGI